MVSDCRTWHQAQAALQRLVEGDVLEGITSGRRDGERNDTVEGGVHQIEMQGVSVSGGKWVE